VALLGILGEEVGSRLLNESEHRYTEVLLNREAGTVSIKANVPGVRYLMWRLAYICVSGFDGSHWHYDCTTVHVSEIKMVIMYGSKYSKNHPPPPWPAGFDDTACLYASVDKVASQLRDTLAVFACVREMISIGFGIRYLDGAKLGIWWAGEEKPRYMILEANKPGMLSIIYRLAGLCLNDDAGYGFSLTSQNARQGGITIRFERTAAPWEIDDVSRQE
jgi:hypothetical protein